MSNGMEWTSSSARDLEAGLMCPNTLDQALAIWINLEIHLQAVFCFRDYVFSDLFSSSGVVSGVYCCLCV